MSSLANVEASLNAWLQPHNLAESWDNVGLLTGSGLSSKEAKMIKKILVTNDLTSKVMDEAIAKKSDMIFAYHPPLFSSFKRLSYENWKDVIVMKALAHDIVIYSPHTTLDSSMGGINDSLIDALGNNNNIKKVSSVNPLFKEKEYLSGYLINSTPDVIKKIFDEMIPLSRDNLKLKFSFDVNSKLYTTLGVYLNPNVMNDDQFKSKLRQSIASVDGEKEVVDAPAEQQTIGSGRIVWFQNPVKFQDIVANIKANLKLDYVQVAFGGKEEISSVGLCAGSGSSLLKGVKADVYLTGEMSHHDILDCVENQISLILCGHCNSERHHLEKVASILKLITNAEQVDISHEDKSPLQVK